MASPVTKRSWKYYIRQIRSGYRHGSAPELKKLAEKIESIVDDQFIPIGDIGDKKTAKKLDSLRDEFIGKPGIIYIHASIIVCIRRGYKADESWQVFQKIWAAERKRLAVGLDSRWLISALDTYVDMGTPVQAARALAVATMFNMLRFAESEARTFGAVAPSAETAPPAVGGREYLWDGVEVYKFEGGDAFVNMVGRVRRTLHGDDVLSEIFETLLSRALDAPTLMRRMNERNWKLKTK